MSSNLTESLLSKFCVNTHKGFRNASYEKFYHPFQTSRSHWHFCCHHTVNSSRYFHRSVEKFLITLNQRRVDRNQKGAKSSSYSPPWPASSGGTTEVKFQSIWQTVLSSTPPESRRWEEWQHKVPINCLTYFMLLFLATWDSSKQTDEAKYFRIFKTTHRGTTFKMPAIANHQPRLPSLLHRVRRFLLPSLWAGARLL